MQELLFGWVGWDGTVCVPKVFIFVAEKEHNYWKNENIALLYLKRKKKNLIYPNSHSYFVSIVFIT